MIESMRDNEHLTMITKTTLNFTVNTPGEFDDSLVLRVLS